jgi:hypothetical protein
MIQLACIDGGACLLIAAAVATGVSTLLVKWGLKKAPCDPHCPEKHKSGCGWHAFYETCPSCDMEASCLECCDCEIS